MARLIGRLTALKVVHAREPGMLADGDGLYLQVSNASSKSWIFRYRLNGKTREMGLGPLKGVSLAAAREKARGCRAQLADGVDPLAARQAEQARHATDDAKTITFDQCGEAFIKAHGGSWKNARHHEQWKSTLETYVSPVFGSLPVQNVDVSLVMKVLEPIWTAKPETAARIRGRIESVLNWAKARGYRSGENPAQWKGHLDNLLPARSKIKTIKHHAALPYDQTAEFMKTLRVQDGVAALALEFTILNAARTGEVIGALWNEIDFNAKIWTVPASRMKHTELTAHGFRSTFRDWAAERTNFQAEVAEAALGHVVGDKVELAYRRGDFFEKRRRLMDAWGEFATKRHDGNTVLPLRGLTT